MGKICSKLRILPMSSIRSWLDISNLLSIRKSLAANAAGLFCPRVPNIFFGRSDYLAVITREASCSPSAVAFTLIFPGVVSGRIIARHIPW